MSIKVRRIGVIAPVTEPCIEKAVAWSIWVRYVAYTDDVCDLVCVHP